MIKHNFGNILNTKVAHYVYLIVFTLSLLAACFMFTSYAYHSGIFVPWENGSLGTRTIEEYQAAVLDSLTGNITLEFPDSMETLNIGEVADFEVVVNDRSSADWLKGDGLTYSHTIVWDDEALKSKVSDMYLKSEDATIDVVDSKLVLIAENTGRDFVVDEMVQYIKDNFDYYTDTYDVKSLCKYPEVYTTDLQDTYDKYKWINDFAIQYDCGVALDSTIMITGWLSDKYEYNIDAVEFKQLFEQLSDYYDTTDDVLPFKTSKNVDLNVPYVTYGYYVDTDSEIAYIESVMTSGTTITERRPAMLGYDSFDKTYIEVSIKDQHVWHYVDGELCCETDCVTGTQNQHDTPTGVYFVSERIGGKYLRGDDYKTWVNQWMRLTNSGIGLHDAYWRNKFGGNIYTYNGSHGCINLPASYASKLFDEIRRGIPVVIYNE